MIFPPEGGHWLVVRGGALGDFVLTLPLLHAIRMRADTVTLVASPRYATLATSLYDHLIDGQGSDALWLHGAGQPPDAFDAAVVVTPGVAKHLTNLGIPHVRQIAAHAPPQVHTGDHLWSAVSDWAGTQPPTPTLRPSSTSLARIDACLQGKRPLVLAPDAAGEGKRWPHMQALAKELSARGIPMVWVPGREQSTPAPRGIAEQNLDLAEIVALAHRCRYWIGNDTGTTHLASAAGAATWVFFGPTDPGRWAPPRSTIFQFNTPISAILGKLDMHTQAAD